jgi:hypothetical protein
MMGWVIDTQLVDSGGPLAYLGPSKCGADPCAKAFDEHWRVFCNGGIKNCYKPDVLMRIQIDEHF